MIRYRIELVELLAQYQCEEYSLVIFIVLYRIILKIGTPQIIIKIVLKSKIWINNKVMCSADADVLANSVGPNQTAYTVKSLIWVCNN